MPNETPQHVYLVIGQTGEHEDKTEWIVCAHMSESEALQHAADAQRCADEYQRTRRSPYAGAPHGVNAFDPDMQMDYDGTRYRTEPVRLYRRHGPGGLILLVVRPDGGAR